MTDNDTPEPTSAFDSDSWLAQEREFAKLCESIRPENKAALFEALAHAGITTIKVSFNGYADSGQIEDIAVKTGDKDVALPVVTVEIAHARWGSPDIVRVTRSISEAIEQLAYDFLRETHAGWENNEGAYGDFLFDVAEQAITLNYYERIETFHYTEHTF
jgi:hypothetical protein